MDLKQMIAFIKKSPEAAALVRDELAHRVAPDPIDINTRILARRKESAEQRAARLTGHFGVANPISAAPIEPRVAAARDVPAPPSIADRLRQLSKGA